MQTFETKQSSLRDFLNVIFKRKVQMVLFFIVAVSMVAVATFLIRPVYEATTQIIVKFNRENLSAGPNAGKTTLIGLQELINSEIELLKSRTLIDNVLTSFGPQKIYPGLDYIDAVLKLTKALQMQRIKGSNIIAITFEHTNPQLAAMLLNTHTNNYFEHHLKVHKNPESYNFFEEQSRILEDKLKQSAKALETFKQLHKVTNLKEEQRLLLTQIAGLRSAMNLTLSQQAATEIRLTQLQQQLDRTPKTIAQGEEVDHNPFLISNFETKLIELELKEKELSSKYISQNRLVKQVKEEIKMVKGKLTELETKRYGKSLSGPNITYQRLKEELLKNQAEQKAVVGKNATQSVQMASFQQKLERLNQIEIELNQLQLTVEVNQQNYRLYLSKFEEARISNVLDSKKITNVSLIEPAMPPLKPVRPKILLNLILGLFLGLAGGLGLIFLLEFLDDSLENPEDVEATLQAPVLASIPELGLKRG